MGKLYHTTHGPRLYTKVLATHELADELTSLVYCYLAYGSPKVATASSVALSTDFYRQIRRPATVHQSVPTKHTGDISLYRNYKTGISSTSPSDLPITRQRNGKPAHESRVRRRPPDRGPLPAHPPRRRLQPLWLRPRGPAVERLPGVPVPPDRGRRDAARVRGHVAARAVAPALPRVFGLGEPEAVDAQVSHIHTHLSSFSPPFFLVPLSKTW